MLLFLISFIAGVLTVLAPCILPLLPVIVGGSVSGGVNRARAYTVAFSLGLSVILFTLILKFSTAFIGVPQYAWMWFSGGVIVLFGVITLFPQIWDSIGLVSRINRESNKALGAGFMKQTFWGDVLVGMALGPVFSTCSPTYFVILATVLPASFLAGFVDLLAYAFGLVLMLLFVSLTGQKIVESLGLAVDPRGWFTKAVGILFIVVGILVFTGAEKPLEAWLSSNVYDITQIEQKLLQLRDGNSTSPMPNYWDASGTSTAMVSAAQKAMQYKKAPEITNAAGYVNTGGKPITIGQFKGDKVVLIDFWTYSCINCQRTLPYLKAWDEKYRDQGLQIIGVHTPEFAFEHVQANVEKAVKDFGLKYPSVLDNEYGTWTAFGNSYWPRKYLIDIDGYIIYDHIGEGGYEETEHAIQAALAERANRLGKDMPASGISAPAAESADELKLGSPETYFGSLRNEFFGSGNPGVNGTTAFSFPDKFTRNVLYFSGTWNVTPEYAEAKPENGKTSFAYKYLAKSVYLVAGSATDTAIEVEVLRDGKPMEAGHAGKDVIFKNGKSYISVKANTLYKVVEDIDYSEHLLEFVVPDGGFQAYAFTFG